MYKGWTCIFRQLNASSKKEVRLPNESFFSHFVITFESAVDCYRFPNCMCALHYFPLFDLPTTKPEKKNVKNYVALVFSELSLSTLYSMKVPFSTRVFSLLFVCFGASLVLITVFFFYHDDLITDNLLRYVERRMKVSNYVTGVSTGLFVKSKPRSRTRKVLLPAGYDFSREVLRNHLKDTASRNWPFAQLEPGQVKKIPSPSKRTSSFSSFRSTLFGGGTASEKKCDEQLVDIELSADTSESLKTDLAHIFKIFLEERDVYLDKYNNAVSVFFRQHLEKEIEQKFLYPFWFRFSGSSVWLEDYNVHFVVSRLIFSPSKIKNKPRISLCLAQIYDENWEELDDVRLVFPTNELNDQAAPTFRIDGQYFSSYRFPRLLPVPFFIGEDTSSNYQGPEDPRVILVTNKNGYKEPVMVYNAMHVITKTEGSEIEKRSYRSMFMSFPFQLQKGKNGLAPPGDSSEQEWFVRSKQLYLENHSRSDTEKNWTPVISNLGESHDFDKHLYLITHLRNIRVVKCELDSSNSLCSVVYGENMENSYLRGGTQLMNLNSLIKEQTNIRVSRLIPFGREIFVGFARTHLDQCGCGRAFYRPNLLVVVRDEITLPGSQDTGSTVKYVYNVSYVSAAVDLGMKDLPWSLEGNGKLCSDVNALIPNSIDSWNIKKLDSSDGRWFADDVMTVLLSRSDSTIDKVNVRGILNALLGVGSLFSIDSQSATGSQELQHADKSSNNIQCAIDYSHTFCKEYGQKQKERPSFFDPKEVKSFLSELDSKTKSFEQSVDSQS